MEERIKYSYVVPFVMTISVGFFYLGYNYRWYNALTYVLHSQYLNEGKSPLKDRNLFNSMVSATIPVGAIFGAIFGSMLVEIGRRNAVIIIWIMQIIGSFLWTIFDFNWLILGRVIQGIVIGSFTVVSSLFINEVSPKSISGSLGMANQLMAVIGGIFAKTLGLFAPLRGDEDILTSQNWRIIFGAPGIVAIAQLILMVFVFKYDSPTYYSLVHDSKNYILINSWIYNTKANDISTQLQSQEISQYSIKKTSWRDLFSANYRKALIICWLLSFFQQATGINCVSFYSNEMFMQGLSGDKAEMSARYGTLFVDIASILGVFSASYMLRKYGRKLMMEFGVGIIWIIFWWLYLSSSFMVSSMIKTSIFLFVFTFNISIGGLLWVYISEVLTSKGISFAAQVNYLGAIFFGSTVNIFFEVLGAPIVYLIFAVIQIISFSFINIFVKETKGLNKAEWERLYEWDYQMKEDEIELKC